MKKVAIIMFVALSLILTSCGSANTEEKAKSAYKSLNASADATDLVMSTVMSSWKFSIDSNKKYYNNFPGGCYAFAKTVGIPESIDVQEVMKSITKDTVYGSSSFAGLVFEEPSYCVACGIKCLEEADIIPKLDGAMNEAKDNIKEISDKNPNAKYLEGLKKYYSEVESYKEYSLNPTGSYIQAQSTAETYRANLKKYKNDLSFDLD